MGLWVNIPWGIPQDKLIFGCHLCTANAWSDQLHFVIGIYTEPGCCVRKLKANRGLMYLTSEGCRPEAVRYIRPPEALGFPTQLTCEVLMTIISWKTIFCWLFFGISALNLWKQGLIKNLFTYSCHDNAQGEQMRPGNTLSSPGCTVWQNHNVYTLL